MMRRDFMKAAIVVSAMALAPRTSRAEVSRVPVKANQLKRGSKTKVFLAGVSKRASGK